MLIHRRRHAPHQDAWALPGVFLNYREPIERAVNRALVTKAGVKLNCYTEQLEYRAEAERDPRGWVTTVAYLLLARADQITAQLAGGDVKLARIEVSWAGEIGGPVKVFDEAGKTMRLAFDHSTLIGSAIRRLRDKVNYSALALELAPQTFTLRELRLIYETILGRRLNRASFQRQVAEVQRLIEPTGTSQTDVLHRPAALYRRR